MELTKVCPKCGIEKSLGEFSKNKTTRDGLNGFCKVCASEYLRTYRQENKEKAAEYNRYYRQKNKEKLAEHYRTYRLENKEKVARYQKAYRQENKEKLAECRQTYYQENKEKLAEYWRTYHQENKEQKRTYQKERKRSDENFRILCYLRSRIHKVLKGNSKSEKTLGLLGCPIEWLRLHLESKFYDREDGSKMTWDNQGKNGWHIDHAVPCSSFDLSDPKEQQKCFHWTNLQPLWEEHNLSKNDSLDWQHPCPTVKNSSGKGRLIFVN